MGDVRFDQERLAFVRDLSDKPEISVVIPCYAQAHFLAEALDSVMRSTTERALEVIVVDDCSPDAVEPVADRYPGVIYYRLETNQGPSCARNLGFSMARGEKVATFDADDALRPEALEIWAYLLDTYEEDLVYGHAELFGDVGDIRKYPAPSWEFLKGNNCIPSACMMRKDTWRRVFEANGHGYDPGLRLGWEDFLFYREMCCLGMKALLVDVVCFRYRQHENSRNKASNTRIGKIRYYHQTKLKELYDAEVY